MLEDAQPELWRGYGLEKIEHNPVINANLYSKISPRSQNIIFL